MKLLIFIALVLHGCSSVGLMTEKSNCKASVELECQCDCEDATDTELEMEI